MIRFIWDELWYKILEIFNITIFEDIKYLKCLSAWTFFEDLMEVKASHYNF